MKKNYLILLIVIFGLSINAKAQTFVNSVNVPTYNTAPEGQMYVDENDDYYIGLQDGSLKMVGDVKSLISSDSSISIAENNNEFDITVAVAATDVVTNLSQSITTGVITYTNEAGNNQTAQVVSTDAENGITVGSDGGAYKDFRAIDVFDLNGFQPIFPAFQKINLDIERINIGGYSFSFAGDIEIPTDGFYEITYTASFWNSSANWADISDVRTELRINGVRLIGSDLYTTHIINPTSAQSASRTIIEKLNRGDIINMHSIIDNGPGFGNILTQPEACSISINKIN